VASILSVTHENRRADNIPINCLVGFWSLVPWYTGAQFPACLISLGFSLSKHLRLCYDDIRYGKNTCQERYFLWNWNMNIRKLIWLPSALVLGGVALSSLCFAGFIFFSVYGFKWSSISEQLIWDLSDPSFRQLVIIPVAIAITMLIGMIINIKISGDLKKVNKVFFILLISIAISILLKNIFGGGAAIMVIVAWLLQRSETKKRQEKNS